MLPLPPRRRSFVRLLAHALACLAFALPAGAVIIDTVDGTGNTTAPVDDPGWDFDPESGSRSRPARTVRPEPARVVFDASFPPSIRFDVPKGSRPVGALAVKRFTRRWVA